MHVTPPVAILYRVGLRCTGAVRWAVFLLSVVLASSTSPQGSQADQLAIGVFPFKVLGSAADGLEGASLERGVAGILVERLADRGVQARMLPWPENDDGAGLPAASFASVVSAARREGVDGFVLGTIVSLTLTEEQTTANRAVGRLGGILGRRVGSDRSHKASLAMAACSIRGPSRRSRH